MLAWSRNPHASDLPTFLSSPLLTRLVRDGGLMKPRRVSQHSIVAIGLGLDTPAGEYVAFTACGAHAHALNISKSTKHMNLTGGQRKQTWAITRGTLG